MYTKEQKIAILGAGPAGLHMGYLLNKNGFKNITIFEQNSNVGGRSLTVNYCDIPYEMGTCYYHFNCFELIDLLKEHGLYQTVAITPKFCKFITEDDSEIPNKDWVFTEIAKLKWGKYLPKIVSIPIIMAAIKEYSNLSARIIRKSAYNIPQNAKYNYRNSLSDSMMSLMQEYNLLHIEKPILNLSSLMCYGSPLDIPAYYGLYAFKEEILSMYIKYVMALPDSNFANIITGGFQKLWESIVTTHNLKVKMPVKIYSITRTVEQNNAKKINISYSYKNTEIKEEFDCLISAIPGKSTLQILQNPSEQEKEVFTPQFNSKVVTRLITTRSIKHDSGLVFWPHELSNRSQSNIITIRNTAKFLSLANSSSNAFITYQYCNNEADFNQSKCDEDFINDLEKKGIKLDKEISQNTWSYFPKYNQQDIQNGLPWKTLLLQGVNNTWYIGSSVSFESINAVLNFNHLIMDMINKKCN